MIKLKLKKQEEIDKLNAKYKVFDCVEFTNKNDVFEFPDDDRTWIVGCLQPIAYLADDEELRALVDDPKIDRSIYNLNNEDASNWYTLMFLDEESYVVQVNRFYAEKHNMPVVN